MFNLEIYSFISMSITQSIAQLLLYWFLHFSSSMLYLGLLRIVWSRAKLNSLPMAWLLNSDHKISAYVPSTTRFNLPPREHFSVLVDVDGILRDIDLSPRRTIRYKYKFNRWIVARIDRTRRITVPLSGSGCWESALKVRLRSCVDSSTNQVSYD